MTRINSNIPPEELHTVHLLREWQELPRIFTMAMKAEKRGYMPCWLPLTQDEKPYKIPNEFCLNTNHMRFFADKLQFLAKRFQRICKELKLRKIKISYDTIRVTHQPFQSCWFQDWQSTEEADNLVRERILERVASNRKKYNFSDDVELTQETWAEHVKRDRKERIYGKST